MNTKRIGLWSMLIISTVILSTATGVAAAENKKTNVMITTDVDNPTETELIEETQDRDSGSILVVYKASPVFNENISRETGTIVTVKEELTQSDINIKAKTKDNKSINISQDEISRTEFDFSNIEIEDETEILITVNGKVAKTVVVEPEHPVKTTITPTINVGNSVTLPTAIDQNGKVIITNPRSDINRENFTIKTPDGDEKEMVNTNENRLLSTYTTTEEQEMLKIYYKGDHVKTVNTSTRTVYPSAKEINLNSKEDNSMTLTIDTNKEGWLSNAAGDNYVSSLIIGNNRQIVRVPNESTQTKTLTTEEIEILSKNTDNRTKIYYDDSIVGIKVNNNTIKSYDNQNSSQSDTKETKDETGNIFDEIIDTIF